MKLGSLLIFVTACTGLLSGCTKAVVGPDLADRPTPFVSDGTVELSDSFGVMQATVTARPEGDTATVRYSELGEKPYNATLTYRAFLPIIAESNAARKDYWLVGLNLTRTADRSFYAIVRYPHGKPLQPGTTRDDFELRLLDCGMYPKPKPAEEAIVDEPPQEASAPDIPANFVSYTENDTMCLFDRIEDVEHHANEILQQTEGERREAQAKNEEDGFTDRWSRLKVVAR